MPEFVDSSCAMVADDTVPYLLQITVFGSPSERVLRDYFAWANSVVANWRAKGLRYVAILDAIDAERPSPAVRSVVSELVDDIRARNPEVEIGTVLITESALIRGALTAIGWLSRSSWRTQPVRSRADAVRLAGQLLSQAGFDSGHLSPVGYRRPQRPRPR